MSRYFELVGGSDSRNLVKSASRPQIGAGRTVITSQPGPGEKNEWLRAWRAIQTHRRSSLALALFTSVAVAIAVLLMKPVYEPTARVEVAPPGNELFSLDPGTRSDSIAYAETQAKNLSTDQLALAVIRKLRLDRNREFVDRAEQRDASALGGVDSQGDPLEMTAPERHALKVFRDSLNVQRDSSSWLINVSFAAHDPRLAALITNTLVEEFLDTSHRIQHDAIVQSTRWLSHQLDDIRARVEQSNRALADFQKSSGITPVGNAQSTFDERMVELNRQLTAAQADRIQLEALLQRVGAYNAGALPQVNADPVVQEILKKLAATRAELKQGQVLYGKNHPKTKELQAQIGELEAQLQAQQDSIFAKLKTSYAAAHTRENLLHSELKVANRELSQMAQYDALRKEAQANESLYNNLYTKIKEAGIAAESKSSNLRWVDRAPVLDVPTRPRRLLDIALGTLAGIVGGVLLAFVREGVDSKIRTADDVKSVLGVSSVSLLPAIGATNSSLRQPRWWKIGPNPTGGSPEVFLLERPVSAEAEALRGLFTSIRFARPSASPQMLLIASSMACEGKTTIAVNLSVALARQGIATCIVDADLRKASVAKVFGFHPRLGLADVLKGSCSLQEALSPLHGLPNLTLLPGGALQDNPGELICSENMQQVLAELRKRFQFILVDSPPILPYADARAVSILTDGVILVGRAGFTTRHAIKRSLELLEQIQSAPVLDVVLNGADSGSFGYQYDYGRNYGT